MPSSRSAPVRTLVGLPMFNEEETVASVVVRCLDHVTDVLCVDDGSSDASSRLAARAGAVHHHHNCGYGAAIRTIPLF